MDSSFVIFVLVLCQIPGVAAEFPVFIIGPIIFGVILIGVIAFRIYASFHIKPQRQVFAQNTGQQHAYNGQQANVWSAQQQPGYGMTPQQPAPPPYVGANQPPMGANSAFPPPPANYNSYGGAGPPPDPYMASRGY